MKKEQKLTIFFNIATEFDVMVSHTTLEIMDHNLFVEHQIEFKFSENNVMMLKYYKTIPCFSDNEQTVRSYFYFLKLRFKTGIFFGLLRVPMMTLPRQHVFLVSMPTFLCFFYQQFTIS